MMSTYEIVVALFSTNTTVPSSTTEVTTIHTKKVILSDVDAEANASSKTET